jgi:signal transduction histidine kinase
LDYLALLAAIGGQALALSDLIDKVGGGGVPIDPSWLRTSREVLIQRLLVYLTAGETLGFSRALYLSPSEDGSVFVYRYGKGSVDAERHGHVSRAARDQGINELLRAADKHVDSELDSQLRGFTIPADDHLVVGSRVTGAPCVAEFQPGDGGPAWLVDLRNRIGAQRILLAPLLSGRSATGLLVVDRAWSGLSLTESDAAALHTFCRLSAANIAVNRAYEERDVFMSKAFHQIRGPLHSLALLADRAASSRIPRQLAQRLRIVRGQCDRLVRVAERACKLARVGRHQRVDQPVDLVRLVQETALLCTSLAEERKVKLRTVVREEDLVVYGDADELSQAIFEVVKNAVEASPPRRGMVEVEVRREDGNMGCISVSDDGPGIMPGSRDDVFREFHTGRPDGGTGLGLPIARQVAASHYGTLTVAETSARKGARFLLHLPLRGSGAPAQGD